MMPWVAAGAEDEPEFEGVGALVGGLSRAPAEVGAGPDGACSDGLPVAAGESGLVKVHAENRQMMLALPTIVAAMLDFPRVPMRPVWQAKPRRDRRRRRRIRRRRANRGDAEENSWSMGAPRTSPTRHGVADRDAVVGWSWPGREENGGCVPAFSSNSNGRPRAMGAIQTLAGS